MMRRSSNSPHCSWKSGGRASHRISRRSSAHRRCVAQPRDPALGGRAGRCRTVRPPCREIEQGGSPSMGMAIEADRHALRWSTDAGSQQLADVIDRHYRDANLRFAISEDMINASCRLRRTWPHGQRPHRRRRCLRAEPHQDQNRGPSRARPARVAASIGGRGTVDSDTESTSGPATFYSTGRTNYATQKLFVLTRDGLTSSPPSPMPRRSTNSVTCGHASTVSAHWWSCANVRGQRTRPVARFCVE